MLCKLGLAGVQGVNQICYVLRSECAPGPSSLKIAAVQFYYFITIKQHRLMQKVTASVWGSDYPNVAHVALKHSKRNNSEHNLKTGEQFCCC